VSIGKYDSLPPLSLISISLTLFKCSPLSCAPVLVNGFLSSGIKFSAVTSCPIRLHTCLKNIPGGVEDSGWPALLSGTKFHLPSAAVTCLVKS